MPSTRTSALTASTPTKATSKTRSPSKTASASPTISKRSPTAKSSVDDVLKQALLRKAANAKASSPLNPTPRRKSSSAVDAMLDDALTPYKQHVEKSVLPDKVISLCAYYDMAEGTENEFKMRCTQMVKATQKEKKCLFFGWGFQDNQAHSREGYADAAGVIAHLKNVNALQTELLEVSSMTRIEVSGPDAELAKLRKPLAAMNPTFFSMECGFRKDQA